MAKRYFSISKICTNGSRPPATRTLQITPRPLNKRHSYAVSADLTLVSVLVCNERATPLFIKPSGFEDPRWRAHRLLLWQQLTSHKLRSTGGMIGFGTEHFVNKLSFTWKVISSLGDIFRVIGKAPEVQ